MFRLIDATSLPVCVFNLTLNKNKKNIWKRAVISILMTSWMIRECSATCNISQFDECSGRLLFFATKSGLGETLSQIQQDCTEEATAGKCMTDHISQCLEGVPHAMMRLVLDGALQVSQEKCNPGAPLHKEYFENIRCINGVGNRLNQCMIKMATTLEAATKADKALRIGIACCNFASYRRCLKDAIRYKCPERAVKFVDSVLLRVAGDLLESVCMGYRPNSTKCTSLPRQTPPTTPSFKTMMPPMAEILQTLG